MDAYLKKLAEAPLANPIAINLPEGRKPAPRQRIARHPLPGDLTPAQARERQQKDLTAKQETLLAYYATTDVPAERVAAHCGILKAVEVGKNEDGSPKIVCKPDVKGVSARLKALRAK